MLLAKAECREIGKMGKMGHTWKKIQNLKNWSNLEIRVKPGKKQNNTIQILSSTPYGGFSEPIKRVKNGSHLEKWVTLLKNGSLKKTDHT